MAAKTDNLEAAKSLLLDIDAEIRELDSKLSGLRAERRRLAESIEFIERKLTGEALPSGRLPPLRRSNLNLPEKVKFVLKRNAPKGLTTAEIKAEMEAEWPNEPVKASSLATTLSVLHTKDEAIDRGEKKRWVLSER